MNPATSSSVVDTETVWSARGSNESSDEASTTEIVTVLFTVPSIKLSSTPVTVTTCAVSQFADVNVSEVVTVASPVSDEVMERMTSVFGCAFRTTVNVSVSPASVTLVEPSGSETVNPATSSSVVDTETVWSAKESKSLSDAASLIETVTLVV